MVGAGSILLQREKEGGRADGGGRERDDEDGLCHFCFAEGRGSAAAPVAAAAPVDSDVTRLPPRPAFRPAARRWGEMNAWEDAACHFVSGPGIAAAPKEVSRFCRTFSSLQPAPLAEEKR